MADAGTPLTVRVLYLSAGGNPDQIKLEMARLGRDLGTFLPHCTVEMGLGELPFVNDLTDRLVP